MSNLVTHLDKLETKAEDFLEAASPWVAWLARAGYAARGVVYCLIGVLAVLAAAGAGGATTGSRGAMRALLDQPFGQALLALLAAGLAGHVLWCFVQAIADPEHRGRNFRGVAIRVALLFRGLAFSALVVAAARMVWGRHRDGGEGQTRAWTAWIMSFPLGILLVGAIGAGVIAFGLFQLYKAWQTKLDRQLDLHRLGPRAHKAVVWIGRFGLAARGVVFALIGGFLVLAAWHANPSEAKDVGQALQYIQGKPYGPSLLGFVAAGFIAYGIYQFVLARYRRIRVG